MKKLILILSLLILMNTLVSPVHATSSIPSDWSQEAIEALISSGEFRPEAFESYQGNLSRYDFIYLAVRTYELLQGEEITINPNLSFNDTEDTYALKGLTVGLTTGLGNGDFGGETDLTREQLATFMVRINTLLDLNMNVPSNTRFDDDHMISSWARDAIYLARSNNILSGVGANMVDPQGKASNEMALVITHRILVTNGYSFTGQAIEKNYLHRDLSYWGSLDQDEVLQDIVKTYSEGLTYGQYLKDGLLMIGSSSIDHAGPIRANGIGEDLQIYARIEHGTHVGQQADAALEKLLEHWVSDGRYIYNHISENTKSDFKMTEYITSPDGTRYLFDIYVSTISSIIDSKPKEVTISTIQLSIMKSENTAYFADEYANTSFLKDQEDYWRTDVMTDPVILKLMDNTRLVTRVPDSYMIVLGTANTINTGTLQVFTGLNKDNSSTIAFQITGWSSPGVQYMTRSLLNYWTPDGAYIWKELAIDFTESIDEWWTAPNGTEVYFTSKGIGFWVYIKR